jgi:ferric-dicitrate binding protein FerR (iron transport regulator)
MKALLCILLLASRPGLGKLAVAVGTVEAKAPGAADFAPVAAGVDLEAGTLLRTGAGVSAAVDLPDGSEVRLAEKSELVLESPRKVELKRGRAWVRIAKGELFLVQTEHSPITTVEAVVDVEFTPRVPNTEQQAFTQVYILEGKTMVGSKKYKQDVTTGYGCTLLGSQLNTPDPMGDPFLPTQWVHPILKARGASASRETERRVRGLLSRLSRQPQNDPFEAALKTLGETSVAVLSGYLQSPENPADLARRLAAARIVGDVAGAGSLLALLDNETADVRVLAAKGLARIAGQDFGRADAYWKGEDRSAGKKAWVEWVRKNAPR